MRLHLAKQVILATALISVAGCSVLQNGGRVARFGNKQTFEDFYFPARATGDVDAAEKFQIVVSKASQSQSGAREAGRYEAVKYCLKQFGQTDVIWSQGPDMDAAALPIVDNTLTLRGECKGWL